ncbi:MAG: DUF1553 domain-containing protein, partial [Verrucomicrobiales bacterium]
SEMLSHGGSLKWLHKTILASAVYQQGSSHRSDASKIDADNHLLSRMPTQRLEAEVIRDAVLAISDTADLEMGGRSARQFHTSPGVHVTPVVDYLGFDPDEPANFRRSIYRFVFRTVPDPLMQALDCPDASQSAPKRDISITALQALAMLNNHFLVRQTEHLAKRLETKHTDIPSQVHHLFELAYSRGPTDAEANAVATYTKEHGLANACRVLINSNEFLFVH